MSLPSVPDPLARGMYQMEIPQAFAMYIQSLGTVIHLEKNQILYKAGDIPDSCYYICQGQIVSYEYTQAGSEHVYSTSQLGELILVPSMVVTHPLSLNFKAGEPAMLVRIPRETMLQAFTENPEFASLLVYSLSLRLITTIESFREKGNYSLPWRVCNLLLHMAEAKGVDYDGKVLIQEKISQQSMANRLHANRVTVARAMRDLKDHGLVEYINGYYCVRSLDKLKKHMDYLETVPGSE